MLIYCTTFLSIFHWCEPIFIARQQPYVRDIDMVLLSIRLSDVQTIVPCVSKQTGPQDTLVQLHQNIPVIDDFWQIGIFICLPY